MVLVVVVVIVAGEGSVVVGGVGGVCIGEEMMTVL